MKRYLSFLLFTASAFAQASHSVQLSWTPSTDTGGTVNIYRAAGSCNATFAKIKAGVAAAGPYTDTVSVGAYCYYVTAVVSGAESSPSNQVTSSATPASPTVLVVVTSN